jgi:predicted permease
MLRRLRHTVDAIVSRARFERDMRDELRIHVEQRTQDLTAAGLSPVEARRKAGVEFGSAEAYKEQCRDARGFAAFRPFHGLAADFRLATRRLLATPQFLIFAVLSLAIGIGVTTGVYSVLYSLIWQPLGIVDAHRVVFVAAPGSGGQPISRTLVSRPDFDDLRAAQRSFTTLAASAPFYQTLVTPAVSDALEGEAVTGDYFRTLGVEPIVGRSLQPRDDETAARVVVLNDRVWRSRFDADPGIVGRVVRLGGQPFEVVGVAPPTFDGIERMPGRTGGWIPLRTTAAFATAGPAATEPRQRGSLTVVGRLAPDRTQLAAAAELASVAKRLDAEFPLRTTRSGDRTTVPLPRGWSARFVDDTNDTDWRMAALILALVGLVLVVACTNLANLMLARGAARQREFAVRRALGAARWRLVRELSVESAVLASLGGVFALIVTRALLALATVDIPLPGRAFSLEPRLNLPALLVASAAVLLSVLVFGLEPSLQLTRAGVTADLSGGDVSIGVPRSRRQQSFIRWQVAISATFFLIAAILAKVVVAEARHESGIDLDRLAMATAYFPPQTWEPARAMRAMSAAADLLRHEKGIDSVALSTGVPFGLTSSTWAIATTPEKPFSQTGRYEMTGMLAATPDVFRTLGVKIVRGRSFDDRDDAGAPRVMVVSEKTARTFFGTSDALGRQLMVQAWGRPPVETFTIVGVARDTDGGTLMSRGDDMTYVPLSQHYERFLVILARTSGDPSRAAGLIQKAVHRADPDVGLGAAGLASIMMAGPYFAARIAASLATALGTLTLLLSMVGLYGVQSHIVARRTRELGVRMAIGANAQQIRRMVLGEGYRPVVEGLLLGLFFGAITRTALRAYVSAAIQPIDPVAFSLVPIPLVIAAFLACYLPARRASRVDPNVALRHL